jgi:3',5'-cyclic AMP phosphodiesterase CpdA
MRVAVVADVQYGDREPGEDRDYRGALTRLERVLEQLLAEAPTLGVQLGDLIDGVRDDREASAVELARALGVLERGGLPWLHVVGNHCLRVGRRALLERYGLQRGYRSRVLDGWRLIVLDTGERATHGRGEDEPEAAWARTWLEEHEQEPRARPWNGAVSAAQLTWLEEATHLGHHPLVPGAAREEFLCWNGEEVAARLAAGGAAAYLAGHDHVGGFLEHEGVPHLTLPAVLAGEHGAWLDLEPGRIRLTGVGDVEDRVFEVRR